MEPRLPRSVAAAGATPYPTPASPAVTRSMRGNLRVGTKPEARLRSLLHRAGLRFSKDRPIRLAQGTTRPDVLFPRLRLAVFVDGCFWHGCPRHGSTPRRNAWYWGPKLRRNRERDEAHRSELRSAGWIVRRLWEHEDPERAAQRIVALVRSLQG